MLRRAMIAAAFAAAALTGLAVQAGDEGPSDLEIAHIAYTAGEIDIRYAHLALALSDNPAVRGFAETMIRDHSAVNDAALGLLDKLGAKARDNPTSRSLLKQAAEKRAELKALSGAAFDRAYAENELAYHQFVNKTVEEVFIPAADNEEFKALLGTALKTFKIHQAHAERLVEQTR
ncbi:DUF4142 domain-containing protein [Amphiplicatus metriothermophilus]|uniref:Putative membrane protein n=1 Tax=Amphiplicatus metriothermophilus TaxID=1519374 RepID=A0A239PJH7_9PROT|nr:DUF4142 domain-containing protein [Amphiplicatus metriothermophilus]MBB5517957.1 putative membrane protein [Amphiplicatus metriothermophilus]SNT67710.1 putative membrane protein [Amphiplicatus metriothermophilus]